ncbi:hypothetical protein K443DRAFT_10135 [Laccaria amethystina LaAM-08-1]|uniref:Uncharacterized protein n=1 Tax=Laccaria amethystina LaAM-08-1 TaxID=1095629 RepID=A0A0C9X6X3_9AGAR|nr:hypothetical protein K443DRAFT_10135 [Laccaria amethystina LaAM-08-1]
MGGAVSPTDVGGRSTSDDIEDDEVAASTTDAIGTPMIDGEASQTMWAGGASGVGRDGFLCHGNRQGARFEFTPPRLDPPSSSTSTQPNHPAAPA